MILRGILDNSLSGQLCIRGFAYIKDLAKISKADYSYQRDPIDERNDIVDFLDQEDNYLFFPEIILGYKIKHEFKDKKTEVPPLQMLRLAKKYASNVDETSIDVKSVTFNNPSDTKNISPIVVVEMYVNENEKAFSRIDGNHRLIAAEAATTDKVNFMTAPFCIILGEEFYKGNIVQKNDVTTDFEKAVKVFFHNINTKTIPLTSEQNLKVIINDNDSFSDHEVESILGKEGLLTRIFLEKHNPSNWDFPLLTDNIRSILKKIFVLILESDKIEDKSDKTLISKLYKAINKTISIFEEKPFLLENQHIWLFKTIVYYNVTESKAKVDQFISWIHQNNLYKIKEIITTSIIDIYNNITSKEIKVFVAMPYFSGTIVESHSAIYESVIKEIKIQYKVNLIFHRPMQPRGATFDLIDDLFEKIKNCEIFISNITDNNPNVTYEMGWARALNKPTIIVKEGKAEKPKSDYANFYYVSYEANALEATLKKEFKENIIAVLNDNYGFSINKENE